MKLDIKPGKYILAVSGGVDSMVLMHVLAKWQDVHLIVAHFNHGIRPDSDEDENFVREEARKLRLEFVSSKAQLGPEASEEAARRARYNFLNKVKDKYHADAIITAHHQDDLLETAFLNLIRGTGVRGLIALQANKEIVRPLLDISKQETVKYARKNSITWREDLTNEDERYLRNYIRKNITSKLKKEDRELLIKRLQSIKNADIEMESLFMDLQKTVFKDAYTLKRHSFTMLPNDVAAELMLRWMRRQRVPVDRAAINRITVAVKTGKPNTKHVVGGGFLLRLSSSEASLVKTERSA